MCIHLFIFSFFFGFQAEKVFFPFFLCLLFFSFSPFPQLLNLLWKCVCEETTRQPHKNKLTFACASSFSDLRSHCTCYLLFFLSFCFETRRKRCSDGGGQCLTGGMILSNSLSKLQ